jgi:signal transduction histidine kinase
MDPRSNKLYRFSLWLIRLRWLGVLCIVLVTFVSSRILEITVCEFSLYIVSAAFLLLNILYRLWLMRIKLYKDRDPTRPLRVFTNFQISLDFFVLTLLLHFSGGIENPFIVYFIFHMVMASIVLTPLESYLQASFAWSLVILLATLEYLSIIQHHPLEGFFTPGLFESRIYLFGTGLVFISTSFLVVYITNSIMMRSRRHEEAYLKANMELEKKDEIKNEYVLRITHDIKGHLAAIQSSLNVLQSKPVGSIRQDCKAFLEIATQRTATLIKFVKDLLYITQLKLSNEFRISHFSIRDSIQKIVADLDSPAKEKSIRIHVEIDDPVDQIFGFQLSIEELITNLLGNAIQYSDQNSVVDLLVKARNKQLLIEIQDHGQGIPDNEQELVFEEFYRGSITRTTSEGTGLGLAISKKIVQTHGGKIWVESGEGKGSKFCFTLPLDDPSQHDKSPVDPLANDPI